MEKRKKYLNITIALLVIFIIYTILVKCVDVKAIGPQNSSVGFSSLNGVVHDAFKYNSTFYTISKYLGYISFLIVLYYLFLGVKAFINTKSISGIDKKLIALYIFYVAVAIVYVLFEIITINYRPVMMSSHLEASYPSSHTLLATCICGSSILVSKYFIKGSKRFTSTITILTYVLMVSIIVCRIISGVHWATDILGGILISSFLLSAFCTGLITIKENI